MRGAGRIKYGTILAVLVGAGLSMLAVTQTWMTVHLSDGTAHPAPIAISGQDASPALMALSLTGLAVALALAIAGRVARIVVGVLGVAVAACVVYACAPALSRLSGVYDAVSSATGIAGHASVNALIGSVGGSIWPGVGVAGGVVMGLASIAAVALSGLWPRASRRYGTAVRFEQAEGATAAEKARSVSDAAVADWDELTRGDDPTAGYPPEQPLESKRGRQSPTTANGEQ